jgi:hypothetical protein
MKRAVLALIGTIVLCATFIPASYLLAQHQYPKGDFSLNEGKLTSTEGNSQGGDWPFGSSEQELFSAATIKVKGDRVTIVETTVSYTIPGTDADANGTISISGEGQYDSQTGTISGTFSYISNGAGGGATFLYTCQGTFSAPPISADQATVSVSFDGTMTESVALDGEQINPTSVDWSWDVLYKMAMDKVGGSPGGEAEPEEPAYKDSGTRFSGLSGEIKILLPGADENDWIFAKFDTPLPFGTRIKTGEESSASLFFADSSIFIMKSETEIIIVGEEEQSNLELIVGKIWCNIKRINVPGGFEVRTNQTVIGIKGTIFSLEEDGSVSRLKAFEGTVDFESTATGESVMVAAGQAVYADASGLGEIEGFDAASEKAEWEALGADFSSGEEGGDLSPWIYIVIAAAAVLVLGGVALLALKRFRGKKGTAAA